MAGPKLLTVEGIKQALAGLASELAADGQRGELVIVGGAAIALTLGGREATRDVDGYISKPEASAMRAAAERVALRLGLPADWLNDAAKGYMLTVDLGPVVFEAESLIVYAASNVQLLAMKLWAWRDDQEHLNTFSRRLSASNRAMLWKTCGNRSPDQVDPKWPPARGAPVGCRRQKVWREIRSHAEA